MLEHPLEKCRQVDYRIKGYRAPMSMITADLNDPDLCFHNFEWLASSRTSLGIDLPVLQNRIVKIPVLFDDYALYKLGMDYASWEDQAIQLIEESDFAAIGLHDCYAQYWLPHYRTFLNRIRSRGNFKTLNQVANEVFLANAR